MCKARSSVSSSDPESPIGSTDDRSSVVSSIGTPPRRLPSFEGAPWMTPGGTACVAESSVDDSSVDDSSVDERPLDLDRAAAETEARG